ncbi:MAG TPA: LLM class flavin-dependent oxidoreductase [Actinomycetota bacterium]|nr:LLM class flavin-dependent oxidoreductase [Actinomycetota bacterium]
MRFGLALPHYDTSFRGERASWDAIRETALTAERVGFDSVWVSDHLFLDWGKYGGPDDYQGSFECWTTLSAVAAITHRVRLGSLTICNDLRNPALLAKMAGSLDLLSGGRLDLGLGAGWYEPEYAATGIPFDGAGTRIRRLGEAAALIGELLEGGEVTHRGKFFRTERAVVRPRPVQTPRPPIWIGGKGDLLLDTVAKTADGWNFSWLGSIDTYRDRSLAADKACADNGRDPQSLRRSVGAYVLAGRDDADARRRFERLIERTPDGVLNRGSSGGAAVSWDEFGRTRVAGTTQEVIDRLGELVDLGVEEVIVSLGAVPFQVADFEDVELIGSDIAPALR